MNDDPREPLEAEDEVSPVEGEESELNEENVEDDGAIDETGQPVAAEQVPQQSRATRKVLAEIERRKALETQLTEQRQLYEAQQRRLDEIQQQVAARQSAPDPEAERRQLEMMDPDQRVEYLINKATQQQDLRLRQMEMALQVRTDEMQFNTYITANPHLQKYQSEVETAFNKYLNAGQPRSRQEILSLVIGEEVKKNGTAAVAKARKTGEENIRRQQTKPALNRSGVSGGSKSEESASEVLRRRLANNEYARY